MFCTDKPRLFIVILLTLHLKLLHCQNVSFRFAKEDFGIVNETEDSFVTLTVEKIGRLESDITVIIKLENSTDDFLTDSWPVLFSRDESASDKSKDLFILDDDLPEENETFTFSLHLTNLNDARIEEPSSAHVTISANDDENGIIGFDTVGPVIRQELADANATATFSLIRRRGTFGRVSVSYRVSGVQDDDSDIYPVHGTIVLDDREESKEFDLLVLDDKIPENDEQFQVTLVEANGGLQINQSSNVATLVIEENDSPLRFSKRIYRVEEIEATLEVIVFRGMDKSGIVRVGPDNGQVLVEYQVDSGSATPNSDYNAISSGVLRFKDREHESRVQIYIKDDNEPELSENFTIRLLSDTIDGDAIIADPTTCIVVIETNDNAQGSLSVDFSSSSTDEDGQYFLIDEDERMSFSNISVIRRGGSFSTVSVQWTVQLNVSNVGDNVFNVISPTSGTLVFEPGQKKANISLNVLENETPEEAKSLIFKLFPDTLQGGAVLERPYEARIIIADSDDVYGVFDIEEEQTYIEIDDSERQLIATISRSGGLLGNVEVSYSAHYLPPGADDVREGVSGILSETDGIVTFQQNESQKEIAIEIENDAFLQTNSQIWFILNSVRLLDRELLVPPRTPRIRNDSVSVDVTEEYANGEIGFASKASVNVNEPEGRAFNLVLELRRQGLSGAAVVQLSYRNGEGIEEGGDYVKGRNVVTFEPGQRVVEVNLEILPDDIPELEEVIIVRLDSVEPSNQKLNRHQSETRVVILENDNPGGVFSFSNQSKQHYVVEENGAKSINVIVERSEGALARRMVAYDVIPNGSRNFFGVPEVLRFPPGRRSATISLIPRDDDVPELELNYTLVLQPYGKPISVLASPSTVLVTVLASDHPHGLFRFEDAVDAPRNQIIGESKAGKNLTAHYRVHRGYGAYGNVSVLWKTVPDDSDDVIPTKGFLFFSENQTEDTITIQSAKDELPESLEEFTIILFNATRGASVADGENATLIIEPNDKAIYFKGSDVIRTDEGQSVLLTVHRDGSGADTTTIRFRTSENRDTAILDQNRATADFDYQPVIDDVITFEPGVLDYDFIVQIYDDDTPEDDESFYVELFDATNDYVPHGNARVKIVISQSDDASGIFMLASSHDITLEEGVPHTLPVIRERGTFGKVSVNWKIVRGANASYDDIEQERNENDLKNEFSSNHGKLTFDEGIAEMNITLEALVDRIPEYDEFFTLLLTNITNGDGNLADDHSSLLVRITVVTNDHPHGLLSFVNVTSPVTIEEDGDGDNDVIIKVDRLMGNDGNVMALWELRPSNSTIPTSCTDLLLRGRLRNNALFVDGRDHVKTHAVKISEGGSVFYDDNKNLENKLNTNLSISLWMMLENARNDPDFPEGIITEYIPLITKYSSNNTRIYSIIASVERTTIDRINFEYRNLFDEVESVSWSNLSDISSTTWNHILLSFDDDTVTLYYDKIDMGARILENQLKNVESAVEHYFVIGSNPEIEDTTRSFLLQDVRLYDVTMTSQEVEELFSLSAANDVIPVAGYLKFNSLETIRNISLHPLDDKMTEENEDFLLSFLDSSGGIHIDKQHRSLQLTVLKSDYANGLFGFSKPCEPSSLVEGQTTTCYVNRSRGLAGLVMVEWRLNSTNLNVENDFMENHGTLEFQPNDIEKSFTVTTRVDGVPELNEEHFMSLVEALPLDGVVSSAPYSGAVIDPHHRIVSLVIASNEKPNGVLQFTTGSPPNSSHIGTIEEESDSPVQYVREEEGHVTLVVVRAGGWYGYVTCEWRTREGTAISQQLPKDFEAAAGRLHFDDGQGFAELTVQLLDDEVSELEKFFFVELSAPTGEASLNNASMIKVVIEPSDDAFGVFYFNQTRMEAAEPDVGRQEVHLQVDRRGGNLGDSVVYWKIPTNFSDDVMPVKGHLNFTEGQTSNDVIINVLADEIPEFDEIFHVEIYEVTRGSIGSDAACDVVVLANDDPRGVLTFDPLSTLAYESDNNVTVTIRRSGGLVGTIRVYYATMDTNTNRTTSDGIAIPGQDFTPITDSVLFGENITTINVTIPLYNDEIPEANEIFFVHLLSAELVSPGISVPNSPRVGPSGGVLVEVVIIENDSPHGILELSDASVRVQEDVVDGNDEGFLFVLRKLGSFGDVTVAYNVIPGSARAEEDYNIATNQVTLLDGETRKALPIRIIDDFTSEIEEDFVVELLPNSVSGGAEVGADARCKVTIEESDDPNGLFGISSDVNQVEEPPSGQRTPVTFTVTRRYGLRGLVGLEWVVTITPAKSTAPGGDGNSSQSLNSYDVDLQRGSIYFLTNETTQTFVIKILPDDFPEDNELVVVKLERILSGHKGRIDPQQNQVHILIPANDRPYGDVSLKNDAIMAYENDNDGDVVPVIVKRSGGLYGTIRVIYSTSEIDVVSELLQQQENLLQYYQASKIVDNIDDRASIQSVDISSSVDPLVTCAEACLREKICRAFFYQPSSYECRWTNHDSVNRGFITYARDDVTHPPSYFTGRFSFYEKNQTQTSQLYDSQARSDLDFRPLSGASVLLYPGQLTAFINISILPDNIPELKEYFQVLLLDLEMLDFTPAESNQPMIKQPSSTRVTIEENDYPYGKFVLTGQGRNTLNDSHVVEVEERPNLSLELVVEREGGSVGIVSVDWAVVGGTALRNRDFNGDDATIKFAHRETTKVISLSLIDDAIPEPDETIEVRLHNPQGGAVLDPDHDRSTVVILANDVVGGVVGFASDSKSLIAQEGDVVTLQLVRSEPALGRCVVTWHGVGLNDHDAMRGLNVTQGQVHFEEGETRENIDIYIKADNIPETKERYKIILNEVETIGISASGSAILNTQSHEAEISIQESDDPHGVFQFASDSQRINIKEDQERLEIHVTRQFGAIGSVRVFFDVIPGTLSTLNPDIDVAQPGSDFTYTEDVPFILFGDGITSAPIVINITNDDIPELVEIFHVNLTRAILIGANGDDVTPILPPKIDDVNSLSQVVIDANDGTKGEVSFNISSANIFTTEGSIVNLSIYRDKGAYGEVSVFIYPQNREAEQDADYICQPETLTFSDSQRSVEYQIEILDDVIPEGNESFLVFLGNPSAGLELGNVTMATVTIVSNDDAHGRLSFNKDAVTYLEEPEGYSLNNSSASLVIKRSPPDGVFGDVSVRFKINEITENGDVIDDARIDDVIPTEGYLTIADGAAETTLELFAVQDDRPELDRKYRVTLFEPGQGATLEDNQTTCEIIIRQNDAPYGDFQVFPTGFKNGSQTIRLNEEKDRFITVDVVRNKGVLGFVSVDLETVPGTAVSLPTSDAYSPMLVPFQILPRSAGVWFHSFQHMKAQYLVYLSSELTSPLTTGLDSVGTFPSLTPGVHSTLYKWEGVYTPVQTLETDGATCATSFTIDDVMYLFITNSGVDNRRETVSRLYKLTSNGDLRVVQDIPTKGASYVVHFYTDQHYLAIANSEDNNQVSAVDSTVLRYSVSNGLFEEVQSLSTRGASGLTVFSQNDNVFLAIANRFDSELGAASAVSSVVYKWNHDSSSFIRPVNVEVSHAVDAQHHIVDERCFLLFTTRMRNNQLNNIETESIKIYQVFNRGPQDSLTIRPHQLLNVASPSKAQILSVPLEELKARGRIQSQYIRNNSVLLLTVSSSVESRVFIFNYESLLFTSLFDAMPASFMYPHTITTPQGASLIVAVATDDMTSQEHTSSTDDLSTTLMDYTQLKSSAICDVFNVYKSNASLTSNKQPSGDYIATKKSILFEPGATVRTVSINLLDDKLPEDEEIFLISLSNERDSRAVVDDIRSPLKVVIEPNDDAFGIIGFDEDSIEKRVEETSRDNVFTLNVVRHKASFGRVAVDWSAEGSIHDVTPVSGRIIFEEGQTKTPIQMTVIADDQPEVEETVAIQLRNPEAIGETSSLQPALNASSFISLVRIPPNDSPHGLVRWAPNSMRVVVNEAEPEVDSSKLVTLELIREQGALGDIEVHFRTATADKLPRKSQATAGADFIPRDSTLIMRENSTRAAISISIIPDDVPEDIESFYVIIDEVTLIGESELGGEPGVAQNGGNIAEISIDENDNARGFIQFNITRNTEGAVEAYELPRVNNSVLLPLSRSVGFARTVGVEWLAQPVTARIEDFFPASGSVQFRENSNSAVIEIFIADDEEVEFMESFIVRLIGTTGGAQLGGDLTVTVNIVPNDSPSGMFGFLQSSQRVLESSSPTDPQGFVEFTVRRFQGSNDEVTLLWELDASAHDDLSPMSGRLIFSPGIRSRSIVLRSLPDQKLEGEEVYDLKLVSVTGGAEISPVAGVAKVIIDADRGAAGTVSLQTRSLVISEPKEGFDGSAVLQLVRGPSAFGRVTVNWQITPVDQNTFAAVQGEAVFEDGQNETEILIQIVDDDLPESPQNFALRLLSAIGGANIATSRSSCLIKVASSDNPHGVFSLSQPVYHVQEVSGDDSMTSLSDFTSYVTVTVLRRKGTLGRVSLRITTNPGSAQPNIDYYPINERIVFEEGETAKVVDIEIINDNSPEGPEEFFVNATDIRLLSHVDNHYAPQPPFNLSIDMPPALADPSWSVVRIAKSDGAEGVVEFGAEGELRVNEEAGEVTVTLMRHDGSYGDIFVIVNSLNQTAKRNVDFLMPAAGLIVKFEDGQTLAYMNITLIDDSVIENEEMFTLAITSASSGVKIGERKYLNVIISKSEYPNGVMRFLGENHLTMTNPSEEKVVRLNLERYGGNQLPVSIQWKIARIPPLIAPTTRSSPLSGDISSPTSGVFEFGDNEGGVREILVRILPSSEDQEAEEHFALLLENVNPAEISPERGNVTITILKKGHPNGIIQFGRSTDDTLSNTPQIVEEPNSGFVQVVFPISRVQGSIGQLNVTWSVTAENRLTGASSDDLTKMTGFQLMRDSQVDTDLLVSVRADDIAELDELFLITLSSVNGGGEINPNRSMQQFVIRSNDNPHGIFGVEPQNQHIVVTRHMSRLLRINVTRDQGLFDKVAVEFFVEFDKPTQGVSYITTDTGTILFSDGDAWLTQNIEIPSSVFLGAGDSFTVRITNVEFVGESLTIEPRISTQYSIARVEVTDEAGNAKLGFNSSIASVYDTEESMCNLTLIRQGLLGDVRAQWSSGYTTQDSPLGVIEGRILPTSDVINMAAGVKQANFSVKIFPLPDISQSFAVHLTHVYSPVGGGAVMSGGREMVEIEPSGVIRFSPSSRNIEITQDVRILNLTVEREYGSRHDINISFAIVPVSAVTNTDYSLPASNTIRMQDGQMFAQIPIHLPLSQSKVRRTFRVDLISAVQPQNLYQGISPRILNGQHSSHVTILASRDAHGYLSFRDVSVSTKESSNDGSGVLFAMVTIQRTVGAVGYASVVASTVSRRNGFGSNSVSGVDFSTERRILEKIENDLSEIAIGNIDYETRDINVSFPEGTNFVSVPVVILNDDVSEPDEAFFVYLHSPYGGARVDPDAGVVKILIEANDNPNGVIGFMEQAYTISENSGLGSVIGLRRSHAFGNVTIHWRAVTRLPYLMNDQGVAASDQSTSSVTSLDPSDQLFEASGSTLCPPHHLSCRINLIVKEDQEAEFASTFFLEIYDVSEGAEIDPIRRFANVTIADSDHPRGLFRFSASSRLPVVIKGSASVGITIERIGGIAMSTKVKFRTRQIGKVASMAGLSFHPAVSDVDYVNKQGEVTFKSGQRDAFISINLVPDGQSANPLPQMFQVILVSSSGGSMLSEEHSVANVTIFEDNNVKRVWAVYETLQQELTDEVLENVLVELHHISDEEMGEKQIKIFHESLNRVLSAGRQRRLSDHALGETYELFCKLLEPSRSDAVRGFSDFVESMDQYALCLTTDDACVTNDAITYVMSSCKHAAVQSSRWYPELINGYNFTGKDRDYFKIPPDLLDASSHGAASSNPQCFQIYFLELSSSVWFEIEGEKKRPMSNKVFSVGVDKASTHSLSTPVRYRVYTNDARISPQGADCVLWNHASSRWLSSTQGSCSVIDDGSNYVECECNHMSVYAASGPTDNLAGYNTATHVASFITMVACLLAPLCWFLCARRFRLATKLLMHMLLACAATQLFFVVSALASKDMSGDSCAAMALLLHYFWLAQFTWMFVQAVHLLRVLSFNKEDVSRMFLTFFLLGWGTPAVIVVVYVIAMYAFGTTSIYQVYGDVHGNREMCAIMNQYGAALAAVVPACLCVLVVITIVFHLYKKEEEWKKFDDIFYGRFNSREINFLCWLFSLISITWLFGGLHLRYGFLWMLSLFTAFNFLLGFFVLIVYDIFRCPIQSKANTMYDGGLDKPEHVPQGYQTASFSAVPSISGDVINKSTQSLMNLDAGWQPNESKILAESIIGLSEDNMKDDNADFDDLISALNIGAGEKPLDATHPKEVETTSSIRTLPPDSLHASEDGSSVDSLRAASKALADTHL